MFMLLMLTTFRTSFTGPGHLRWEVVGQEDGGAEWGGGWLGGLVKRGSHIRTSILEYLCVYLSTLTHNNTPLLSNKMNSIP